MQLANLPAKFYKAFGANASPGNIREIPVTTSDLNAASQSTGWAPNSFVPECAGGVPPSGLDMNGLDNMMSAWNQWQALGGAFPPYDSTFQAAVGGYFKTSIVGSITNPGTFWISTADNNTTNPDASGAGWQAFPSTGSIPWSSPPNIGDVAPNGGRFTALVATLQIDSFGFISGSDLQINGVGFTESFGQNNYQKLPTGYIVQSGRFFSATGSGDVISLPTAFPNNGSIVASCAGATEPTVCNVAFDVDFSTFQVWTRVWNGSGWTATAGVGVGWTAIGN